MALVNALEIILDLIDAPTSMESLQALTGLSRRQVMRAIDEARLLGADIRSNGRGPGSRWMLHNGEAVERLTRIWLERERAQSVLSS